MLTYTTHTVWLDVVRSLLDDAGYNAEKELKAIGVAPDGGCELDDRVDTEDAAKAWRLAVKLIGDPRVGIHGAETHFQPVMWRALGLAVLCSSSLRDAMERMVRYSEILTSVALFEIRDKQDITELWVSPRLDAFTIGYEAADFGAACIVKLLREIFPGRLNPVSISLQRPAPESTQGYRDFFGCEVKFDCDQLSLLFRREDVDRELPMGNTELAAYQDQFSEDYIARFGSDSVALKVKDEIVRLLAGGGEPVPRTIAVALNVSLRNLQRKLSEEGTSFKDLLTEIRQQLAADYLKQPYRSFNEIAYLLGFSDHSNFTRAFKRWYGKSPTQYRTELSDNT